MRRSAVLMMLLAVASCAGPSDPGGQSDAGAPAGKFAEIAADAPAPAPASAAGSPATRTGAAFIAYVHDYRFELPAAALDAVRQRHAARCEALGPARCQLLGSTRTAASADAIEATLELRIVPAEARAFAARARADAEGAEGRLLAESITGEDLTRQMIDAEAALKAKTTLRDRLQALLERRDGKLADLLETERALAETQQQLDAATALLAELRQRVGFSRMTLHYRSEAPLLGTGERPVADALASAGLVFSESLAALIGLIVAALPWAPLVALAWWLLARRRRARRATLRAGEAQA